MSEENEKIMSFAMKDIPLMGEPVKIKLDCAKAPKTGESKYGNWYLWFGYIENAPKVYDKNEKTGKFDVLVENYTGKISFFPTEKLNEQLETLANGNIGVEVSIRKEAEEVPKGLIKRYVAEKLSEGEKPKDSMTVTENKLVTDTLTLKRTGFEVGLEDFVKASQADIYEGKISETRAKELFYLMKNMQ